MKLLPQARGSSPGNLLPKQGTAQEKTPAIAGGGSSSRSGPAPAKAGAGPSRLRNQALAFMISSATLRGTGS